MAVRLTLDALGCRRLVIVKSVGESARAVYPPAVLRLQGQPMHGDRHRAGGQLRGIQAASD